MAIRDPQSTAEEAVAAGDDPLLRAALTLTAHLELSRAAWDRIEQQAIPLLERIAAALERGVAPGTAGADAGRSLADDVRAAIAERRWDQARALLDAADAGPAAGPLRIELDRAAERASADLTAQVEAARAAGDADGAMRARDELAQLLDADALRAIDRPLIGWLMGLIQRRLRSVPVGADVAVLAGAIADRFGGTPEGASLRAALPTLRRSAGLCPRCAEPYLGVDEACPRCLATAGLAEAPPPILTFVSDDLDEVVGGSEPIDLNDARNWQVP